VFSGRRDFLLEDFFRVPRPRTCRRRWRASSRDVVRILVQNRWAVAAARDPMDETISSRARRGSKKVNQGFSARRPALVLRPTAETHLRSVDIDRIGDALVAAIAVTAPPWPTRGEYFRGALRIRSPAEATPPVRKDPRQGRQGLRRHRCRPGLPPTIPGFRWPGL